MADGLSFSSINPYDSLVVIKARTSEELIEQIVAIKKPIKIHFIVSHSNRLHAFVQGDIKRRRSNKNKQGVIDDG